MSDDYKGYLSIEDAIRKYPGFTGSSIRRLAKNGVFATIRGPLKKYLILEKDIDDYLSKNPSDNSVNDDFQHWELRLLGQGSQNLESLVSRIVAKK